jgi:hypothetical protein
MKEEEGLLADDVSLHVRVGIKKLGPPPLPLHHDSDD